MALAKEAALRELKLIKAKAAKLKAPGGQGGRSKAGQDAQRTAGRDRQPNSTCRWAHGWAHRCMPMTITTALDVARRARGILAMGRTIDSPTQRVEWAHLWAHQYMLLAITTALDVARRARGIVALGRAIDSPTQRVEWAHRWAHRCMLWRSQRRTMWRVVLAVSWSWGARPTAQLNMWSGCIDGVIDACLWRPQRRSM